MSCSGLKENEQEAIKADEKEYKPSRVWGNYFLNALHPDAKMNNGCARIPKGEALTGMARTRPPLHFFSSKS